jgi:DNA-binding response OmpR family regulator
MSAQRPVPSREGRRIVICDYNALLQSVTGLLRMSGYCVFQAYDAQAALELCGQLPNIRLLILNTTGTGVDSATLVRQVRGLHPDLPVLHIGNRELDGMPADVPTLAETFTAPELLAAVVGLMPQPGAAPVEGAPPIRTPLTKTA